MSRSRVLPEGDRDESVVSGGRVLVAGWFSFADGHATAGDLLACDVVCDWIAHAGRAYDVAFARPFTGGVDWRSQQPEIYSHVVFVCGPFANSEELEGKLFQRFHRSRLIGVNLTMLYPIAGPAPFDHLFERDSNLTVRPDLVFSAPYSPVPLVGVCLVEDYPEGDTRRANALIDDLTASREMSVVAVDTRLDVVNTTGLRTPREIESLIAHMDVLITTRLHGMVMALKHRVPVVAIDPEPGGAKIRKQADFLGWPMIFDVDRVTAADLRRAFDYCLTLEARNDTKRCVSRAAEGVATVRKEFLAVFQQP